MTPNLIFPHSRKMLHRREGPLREDESNSNSKSHTLGDVLVKVKGTCLATAYLLRSRAVGIYVWVVRRCMKALGFPGHSTLVGL